jgi:putative membrane protein
MTKLVIRTLINAVGLYAAVALVDGIVPQDPNWVSFIWLALIFGLLNAMLRPLISLLTCPLILLTLGFGTLLINTLMFYLAGAIGTNFGVGFTVAGFWPAFLGSIIVSLVSVFLSLAFRDELKDRKKD